MLTLRVLGTLALDAPDLPDDARVRRRYPLALLAIVASARAAGVTRDRIMSILWADSDQDRGSNSLRQTLYLLRRELGEDLFLPETSVGLRLDPSVIRVDLWDFEDAAEAGQMERAADLYGGAFLDGFQLTGTVELNEWIETRRQASRRRYHQVLDAAARTAQEEGRLDDTVTWRERHAADDPYSSRVARALLEAMVAAGDRTGALRYAGVYEQLVRTQLHTEPDPRVADFAAALRADPDMGTRSVPPAAADPDPGDDPGPAEERTSGRGEVPEVDGATREEGGRLGRTPLRRPWTVAVLALLGVASLWVVRGTLRAPPGVAGSSTIVVASGTGDRGGWDPATRLVTCSGPACPEGPLPQQAYVVPPHRYYPPPVVGTGYISPVPDGTTRTDDGYPCCTMATFESEFRLPAEASSARISITLVADNRARVGVNGQEFGMHADSISVDNYSNPMNVFGTAFRPDPSGINHIRIVLEDYGGALGLHYHATITFDTGSPPGPGGEAGAPGPGETR